MLTFSLNVVFILFFSTQRICANIGQLDVSQRSCQPQIKYLQLNDFAPTTYYNYNITKYEIKGRILRLGTRAVDPNSQLLIENDNDEKPVMKNFDETGDCSLDVDHDNFFDTLRKLEDDNKNQIAEFEKAVGSKRLDAALMHSMLSSRGLSQIAIQQNLGRIDMIPAGIDLGGFCVIKMLESFLFFHRMKLRNSTNFKIKLVENDLKSLVVRTKLSLNDLHLQGTYERLMQDGKNSNLFYSPTQGVADIMLKDVEYKMEGRYRMLNERITIDIVVSTVRMAEAVIVTESMSGKNKSPPFRLRFDQVEDLLQRLKGDIDTWIKDCFNDRLLTYSLGNPTSYNNYLNYHISKTIVDNNYLFYLINVLQDRINKFYTEAVSLPDFTIFSVDRTIFRIRNGALRGLDSIFKKSAAASYLDGTLRHVCGEIGFNHLQVSYTYEALPETPKDDNNPALTGTLILSAKDLTAILVAGVMIDPKSVELSFQGLTQLGTESLTIEGAANKELGRYRHIIQKHVMALMSYSINFHVRNLKTLTDCQPNVIPYHESMKSNPIKIKSSKKKKKSGIDWWINIYGDSGLSSESKSHDRSKEDSSKEDKTTTKKHKSKTKKPKTTTQDSSKSGESGGSSKEDSSKEEKTTTKKHKSKTKKPKTTTQDSSKSGESGGSSKEDSSKEEKTTTKKDKKTTEKDKKTTEKDKTTTEKDKTTTEKDKTTTEKAKTTTEKDKTTTETNNTTTETNNTTTETNNTTTVNETTTQHDESSNGDSYEIISQGLLLRHPKRKSNKSNYNKNGKNKKEQILLRQLRRRFRPLKDLV